jgi:hypothetical protein
LLLKIPRGGLNVPFGDVNDLQDNESQQHGGNELWFLTYCFSDHSECADQCLTVLHLTYLYVIEGESIVTPPVQINPGRLAVHKLDTEMSSDIG